MKYLEDILTPKQRKIIYAVFGLTGVLLSAIAVGFVAAAVAIPVWLKVTFAVYGSLGGGVGLTAVANVPSQKP